MEKDSLDMNNEDRQKIYDAVLKKKEENIIITHGTDTIKETAKKLSEIKGKRIILVGALKPETIKDSDAHFNIGVAVGAINNMKEGVYIAMSGRIYNWEECKKDPESGRFLYSI